MVWRCPVVSVEIVIEGVVRCGTVAGVVDDGVYKDGWLRQGFGQRHCTREARGRIVTYSSVGMSFAKCFSHTQPIVSVGSSWFLASHSSPLVPMMSKIYKESAPRIIHDES